MIFAHLYTTTIWDQLFEGLRQRSTHCSLGSQLGSEWIRSAQERKAKLKVIFSVEVGPWARLPRDAARDGGVFQAGEMESPVVVVMVS